MIKDRKVTIKSLVSTAKADKDSTYHALYVDTRANKKEIKEAVELVMPHVQVKSVRTIVHVNRKSRPSSFRRVIKNGSSSRVRTAYSSVMKKEHTRPKCFVKGSVKKALIRLAKGQTIQFKD